MREKVVVCRFVEDLACQLINAILANLLSKPVQMKWSCELDIMSL